MFMGTFTNKVDSKSRVSVPHEFRTLLADEDDYSLICFRSFTATCLDAGGVSYIRKLLDMMEDMEPYGELRQAFEFTIIGDSIRLPIDKDGRVTLTEKFFEHAKIEDQIAFVGCGNHVQLWNPDLLQRRSPAMFAAALENRDQLKSRGQARTAPAEPGERQHRPSRNVIRPAELGDE